jgi:hypothetical protein
MTKRQIPKPLYVKAMKAFKALEMTSTLPAMNQALRGLGMSQEDIDTFWESCSTTRVWKQVYGDKQKWLHSAYEAEVGPDNPDTSYGDDGYMLGCSADDEKDYKDCTIDSSYMKDIADAGGDAPGRHFGPD